MGKLPFGSAGLISKLFGSKKNASPLYPFLKKANDAGTGTWPATLNNAKIPEAEKIEFSVNARLKELKINPIKQLCMKYFGGYEAELETLIENEVSQIKNLMDGLRKLVKIAKEGEEKGKNLIALTKIVTKMAELEKLLEFYSKVPNEVDASATPSKISKLASEIFILIPELEKEAKEEEEDE